MLFTIVADDVLVLKQYGMASENVSKTINSQRTYDQKIVCLVVRTVPADGLVLLGVGPSAGTMMTMFINLKQV